MLNKTQKINDLQQPQLNLKLFFWALVAALAGFLFGFDTVVISGAEKTIQALWQLNDVEHGLAISMALWGTVFGALCGSWPTDKFGRKKTLLAIGFFYFISALWSAFADDPYSFMIARFIGGVGVGISTIAAPLYIAEIAPAKYRGRLTAMFQFNIVLGILIAFISNAALSDIGENSWRWMLGIEALPAVLFFILCFLIPESPRWLVYQKQNITRAKLAFTQIQPELSEEEIDKKINDIMSARHEQIKTEKTKFWSHKLKIPICLAFFVAFFNQLSGINAILYFSPRIFGLTGLDEQAALLQSVGIGVTNLIFTFLGLYLIDRLGRKTLLLFGSLGYIVSLSVCAFLFAVHTPAYNVVNSANQLIEQHQSIASDKLANDMTWQQVKTQFINDHQEFTSSNVIITENIDDALLLKKVKKIKQEAKESAGDSGLLIVLSIFTFIAAHAIGQGAVIWVLISEIFPTNFRATGQSLGSFTHWFFAALLTLFFPLLVNTFSAAFVFTVFLMMMILQLIWVIFYVPETKGISLEALAEKLVPSTKYLNSENKVSQEQAL